MSIADKKFFTEHHNEVKSILNDCGVTKCALNFRSSKTQIFLEFKDKKNFAKVENALMKLCNQYDTAFTVSLSAFSARGRPLLGSDTAISFEDLKQEIKDNTENNDKAKVTQGKDEMVQASHVVNEAAKALMSLSKTTQSLNDIEMVYKVTNFPAIAKSLSEFINLCQEVEKDLYKQHSESHQTNSIFFVSNK